MKESVKRAFPALFVFLWSTGFIVAKYIHPYSPPFAFLAIRYVLACSFLVAFAIFSKTSLKMTRQQIWYSVAVGALLHVTYIGGVFYGVSLGVSAGISATIVSLQPVLVSILAVPMLGERLCAAQIIGLLMGVVGVALLLLPKVFQGDTSALFDPKGIAACVIALVGTTGGYLVQKRSGNIPFVPGTAMQFGFSALAFTLLSVSTERPVVIDWSYQFFMALAWIVFALSLGSIFILYYLLRHGSAGSVSSLYYLVPPSSALMGYFLFGEHIGATGLIGMALAACGVALVMRQASN